MGPRMGLGSVGWGWVGTGTRTARSWTFFGRLAPEVKSTNSSLEGSPLDMRSETPGCFGAHNIGEVAGPAGQPLGTAQLM